MTTNKDIEEMAERLLSQQDTDTETYLSFDQLHKALTEAHQAGIDEAMEVVEGIRNDEDVRAHQSNDNFKHYAVGVLDRLKEALQDNK